MLAAALAFVPVLTNSLRLAIWTRFLGHGLSLPNAVKVITGTMIANSVTPSATGSVPIKLMFLIGEGIEAPKAITLISFQAAEDMLVLAGLAGLCLGISGFALFDFLQSDPRMLARLGSIVRMGEYVSAGAVLLVIASIAIVASGLAGVRAKARIGAIAARARGAFTRVVGDWVDVARRGKSVAFANVLLALAQWSARFSIAGLVLAAFGTTWSPALFWLLQYLVQSIGSIVPTPGGAGGSEAAFLLLFAPFVDAEILLPAMSAWRLSFFYLPLVGAALAFGFLQRSSRRRRDDPAAFDAAQAAAYPAE